MLLLTIPKIFFNYWLWFALIAIVIAVHFFWGKTPPPPKQSKFFAKHKKTIYRIADIFLILVILFGWVTIIYMSTSAALESIMLNRTYNIEPLSESLRFALASFLISAIPISGISGVCIGSLSVFYSNITKVKRIILLIISLLPIIFTILLLLIKPTEEPELFWLTIKLGLGASFGCWLINGPAIIIGKHFFRAWWAILRALRLVSGDYPG